MRRVTWAESLDCTDPEFPDMPADRPNIIFIITDQQRFDTIRALGFDYMETPNLDRLVREGVTFSNCQFPRLCQSSL